MAWSSDEATHHIEELAKRLRAKVYYRDYKWEAHLSTRMVWVPHPKGSVEYLVALHELGHLASATARRRGLQNYPALGVEVLVEGAAWAWASAVARPALVSSLGKRGWQEVFAYLGSYIQYAALADVPDRLPQL